MAIQLPRQQLSNQVSEIEDRFLVPVRSSSPALALARTYVDTLLETSELLRSDLLRVAPHHISELIALALGATRDAAEQAKLSGIRAARLHAIKQDVRGNIGARDLSVAVVAARHGLYPRYVQRLFEAEGTTFSGFVLAERLDRVHRILCDATVQHLKVSEIAYSVRFSDLSHFNRAFRRRFGLTPSDTRNAAFGSRSRQ